MQTTKSTINPVVFFTSSGLILLITVLGSTNPELAKSIFSGIQSALITNTSWIYILSVAAILLFAIWLMISRVGDIKLGPDHSEPDYDNMSWFAMLFSAGMGIGLLFFGVSEPLMHYSSPPTGDAQTVEAAREALKITFFHWGLHAWAIYAIMAVSLAYFCYRKNLPLLPRSVFHPILGEKIHGKIGDVIDTFCVLGTLFGVATSLGLGVAQVNAGLNYLFGLPVSTGMQIGLIAIITSFATISVVLGLDAGIKRLSNLNMILAVALLGIILFLGPTSLLLKSYVQNSGAYLSDIIYKTFNLYAYEKKNQWIGGWTLLYWGWWVSWAPFVGTFIARISRGRTIREFMVGVVFLPVGFTCLWMTVFGNSAIEIVSQGKGQALADAALNNVPVALFRFFEFFPMPTFLSVIGLILVITFFVSSSDSGSLVVDTLASGGAQDPPVWQRIYWASVEGIVAAVLLLAGGLEALQTMTIAAAFPMMFMLLIGAYCFYKALKQDLLLGDAVQDFSTSARFIESKGTWEDRLDGILTHPKSKEAKAFLNEIAQPALEDMVKLLKEKHFDVTLEIKKEESIRLVLHNKGVEDFYYGIRLRPFLIPSYMPDDGESYYRAEVFLLQGGQDYDLFGFNKEQVISDVLSHLEKHFHFLHIYNSERPEPTV